MRDKFFRIKKKTCRYSYSYSPKLLRKTQLFVNRLYFETKKKDIDMNIFLVMKNTIICLIFKAFSSLLLKKKNNL